MKLRIIALLLLLCSFQLEGLLYQDPITKTEEPWLRSLIEQNFSLTPFANTIIGSKPMASTVIDRISHKDSILELENDPRYTESERACIVRIAKQQDIHDEWQKWMSFKSKLPIQNFLFRSEPAAEECKDKLYFGVIINVREVIWTLEKHYDLFARELGMHFNPLKVTLEFENLESEFWKKVLMHNYLSGILYGFGERNAYFFSLSASVENENLHEKGIFLSPEPSFDLPNAIDVPAFRSFHIAFDDEDPIRQKHTEEVAKINKLLEGKDRMEVILQHLMQ